MEPRLILSDILKQRRYSLIHTHVIRAFCKSLESVIGFTGIRYYRYDNDMPYPSLISAACIGPNKNPSLFRAGAIIRFDNPNDPQSEESFLSFRGNGQICYFVIDPKNLPNNSLTPPSNRSSLAHPQPVPNHCMHVRKPEGARWIDIPLCFMGKFIGKLSCDLKRDLPLSISLQTIKSLLDCSRQIEPIMRAIHLETLERSKRKKELESLRNRIAASSTTKHFMNLLATALPKAFECENVSVFTLAIDSNNWHRLILRATTYHDLAVLLENPHLDKHTSYNLGADGSAPESYQTLTGWVASNRRSLRLHNFPTREELLAKCRNERAERFLRALRKYDPRLQWGDKLRDSDTHTSFLAVPIIKPGSKPDSPVLGVIRLTQKRGHAPHFTGADEALLTWFIQEVIAPKLADLPTIELATSLIPRLEKIFDPASISAHLVDHAHRLCQNIREVFQGRGGMKMVWLNILSEDNQHFEHRACDHTPQWTPNTREGEIFSLKGSLTNSILDIDDPVYICDLEHAEREGTYKSVTATGAACAVGHQVTVKGVIRCAIIVLSDRFDIDPLTDGALMRHIAKQTEYSIERLKIRTLSFALSGFKHDCENLLSTISYCLADIIETPSGENLTIQTEKARRILNTIYQLIGAYTDMYPLHRSYIRTLIGEPKIRNLIDTVLLSVQAVRRHFDGNIDIHITPQAESIGVIDRIFCATLFNVIKNAFRFAKPKKGNEKSQITIDLTVNQLNSRDYVFVVISNSCPELTKQDADNIKWSLGLDAFVDLVSLFASLRETHGKRNRRRRVGLALASQLLRYYELEHKHGGHIIFKGHCDGKTVFELAFPVWLDQVPL